MQTTKKMNEIGKGIQMEIKSWENAIDLTIKSYEYAIENNISFSEAKKVLLPEDWGVRCPLCMHALSFSQSEEEKCGNCLWVKLEGRPCRENYDEAIDRLKRWRTMLNKEGL